MTKRASLTLDMHPREFRSLREEFLTDLASLLRIHRDEISIVSVNDGCTNLELDLPDDADQLFQHVKIDHAELPESINEDAAKFRKRFKVNPLIQRPAGLAEKALVAERRAGNKVTWLHISDAHFEAPESGTRRDFWVQDKVRDTFITELPRMLVAENIYPDFVFFTGDVAFSGKQHEYTIAHHFFEELKRAIPQGKNARFVCIPGNHDVDREAVDQHQPEEKHAAQFLDGNKHVIEYLASPNHATNREGVFNRLTEFEAFAKGCQKFGQPRLNRGYFFTDTFQCRKLRIGVAGLNTAWRCSDDQDRGRLVLGLPQIDAALKDVQAADVAIGLMHHPPGSDWFIDDDKAYQRTRLEEFDFVLHGHEHDPTERFVQSHGVVSAGALYTREKRPQSVNAMELDLDTSGGRLLFWRLSEKRFRWVKDVDLCDDGQLEFYASRNRSSDQNAASKRKRR